VSKPNEIRHPQAALLAEEYVCQRVQSLGYTADLNSEEVNQLTDANVVEVVDSDPTVSLTIDSNEFGSINLMNQLAGFNLFPSNLGDAKLTYPTWDGNTVDNTNHRDGTISHVDFGQVATDFMVPIKEVSDGTTSRTLWFSNCFIDSVSGTYQVDGFASESVSMSGSAQQWFLNAWSHARVETAIFSSTAALDHSDGDVAGGGAEIVYVTEDGIKLPAANWTASGSTIAAVGYTFASGSRYRYVVVPNAGSFPTLTQDTGSLIGGVKEGEIELILWDGTYNTEPGIGVSGDNSFKGLRVQSIDYEFSFDREDLKQLYTGTYYKGLNTINITASLSVLDSDLELWALTTGNLPAFTAETLKTLQLSDFQSMGDLAARVDVFNTKDYLLHDTGTLLKSITLIGGKVTSVGDSRDVPGRGTQTFEIQFTEAYFTGTGLVGR
jgi:hypothetical protein